MGPCFIRTTVKQDVLHSYMHWSVSLKNCNLLVKWVTRPHRMPWCTGRTFAKISPNATLKNTRTVCARLNSMRLGCVTYAQLSRTRSAKKDQEASRIFHTPPAVGRTNRRISCSVIQCFIFFFEYNSQNATKVSWKSARGQMVEAKGHFTVQFWSAILDVKSME